MGIFERIRQASPWVLTTFAIVFVGFMVLGDMDFSSIQTANNNPGNREIATVNGASVSYLEYENTVKEQITRIRQQNQQAEMMGQQTQNLDENAIRRSIFTNMVDRTLMEEKSRNMGVVTNEQVAAEIMLTFPQMSFPRQLLQQAFMDSTGAFLTDKYMLFLSKPEEYARMAVQSNNADQSRIPQFTQDIRSQIKYYNNELTKSLPQSSVQLAMQEAGSFMSEEFLKNEYIAENSYADFEMIYLKTSAVPDSDIEVTDEGLREFYNKYQESYRQEAQRKIKYASFKLEPSAQDTANAQRKLKKIAMLLNKAQSPNEAAKLFKDASYEYGGVTTDLVAFSQLDRFAKSYLKDAVEGDIVGPAKTATGTNYYRVIEIDSGEVSEVKASHILINFNENKDSALKEANLIYQRANRGEDFATLARQYSKDPGSGQKGGDLGYFGKGQMVKEFEQAAFDAEIGTVTKPVESQFGYHIIKVDDKVDKKYQIETIEITPGVGSTTKKQIEIKALELSNRVKAGEDFDTVADELGAAKGETAPFFELQPILGSGYINSFAFTNEKGSVSKPLELDNFGITVVQVSEIIPEGIPDLETVRNDVEFVYKNKLKKDKLEEQAQKIYEAVSSSGDMQAAKSVDTQINIRRVSNAKNTGLINGVQGKEKAVTEVVYNQEIGSVSQPIRGNTGYFIVKTLSKNIVSDEMIAKNLKEFKEKKMTQEKRAGYYQWFQNAKKDAEIVDKRAEIYTKY